MRLRLPHALMAMTLTSSALALSTPIMAAAQQTDDIKAEEQDSSATEELLFAPVPDWVETLESPKEQSAATLGMAGSYALINHQHKITDDGGIYYHRQVFRILDTSVLNSAGTITLNWTPGRERVTLHHLAIIRDDERIDIMETGQTFSYLQREANLAQGILDGKVTATLLIEDLRVGDMIDLSYSLNTAYEPLKGHYQFTHNYTGTSRVDRLMQRVVWPQDREVFLSHGEGLPEYSARRENGFEIRELMIDALDEKSMPDDLPERFYYDRVSQISTFASWGQVAERFRPLFAEASTIPETGPLRDMVTQLRAANLDRKALVERALTMVQSDVRYVGNFAGLGNYSPENAASVWDSKFGDCKGKTVLLTAILREFGYDATPVLVNTKGVEAIDEIMISPSAFNHVFVRLNMDGKTYWLDGTRLDDQSLERLPPNFYGYVLPLDDIAEPYYLHDEGYERPQGLRRMVLDVSDGLDKPARFHVEEIGFDDSAKGYIKRYGNMTETTRQQMFEKYAETDIARDSTLDDFRFIEADDKLTAKLVSEGTMIIPWINGKGFQKYLASELNVGRNFFSDREDAEYNDYPMTSNLRYYGIEVEIIFPEDFGAIAFEGSEFESEIGPARYIRRLSVDGNRFIGYAETRVKYAEYTPEQALQWDSESDVLYDDKVYISFAPQNSPALAGLAGLNSAIEKAYMLGTDSGNDDQIRALLDPLIDMDPNNVRLLIARGKLIMDSDPLLSERDLLRAMLLERSNIELLQNVAQLYIDNDETALARRMLDRILDRNEEHVWAKKQREALSLGDMTPNDDALAESNGAAATAAPSLPE